MNSCVDYTRYDDETLIGLIAQSGQEALTQLYERYRGLVFSLAFGIVHDRATAEEITLDVFMRIWQNAALYDVKQASVRTWLTHIVRHHAIDVLRRRAARLDHNALNWDALPPQGTRSEEDL